MQKAYYPDTEERWVRDLSAWMALDLLMPTNHCDASLKWCYLHIKEQDWESWRFLAKLCSSDSLCYSHSWRTGQTHMHSAVMKYLTLAAKKKVNSCSQAGGECEGEFCEMTASVSWLTGKGQVCISILHHSHPPHAVGPLSGVGSRELKQLLPGRAVQAIMLASLKPCPWPTWICRKSNMMLYTVWLICCSSIFLHSLSNSAL